MPPERRSKAASSEPILSLFLGATGCTRTWPIPASVLRPFVRGAEFEGAVCSFRKMARDDGRYGGLSPIRLHLL